MLITPQYREQNRTLHEQRPDYGTTAKHYARPILDLAVQSGSTRLIDYGCGKGLLAEKLDGLVDVVNYDPAVAGCDNHPEPEDMLVSVDVLEHIEPDCLDDVLADMAGLMKRVGLFTVSTRPAKKSLPDGRNAHLIVEDFRWWLPRIWAHFHILQYIDIPQMMGFMVIVGPKEQE